MTAASPAETVELARGGSYGVVAVGSAVLLVHLYAYARDIAVELGARELAPLGLGVGAGAVYGVAGLADTLTAADLAAFVEGATLFVILGVALGIRGMARARYAGGRSTGLPEWLDYAVLAGFVAAWWLGFLGGGPIRAVVVVGWVGASVWALYYSVLAVRVHEGTSIAAVVRPLLPAVIVLTGAVFVDIVGGVTGAAAAVEAVWLVGSVLLGAFLFTTAVAIRQQGGEVKRLYDWTTWRGDRRAVEDGGD